MMVESFVSPARRRYSDMTEVRVVRAFPEAHKNPISGITTADHSSSTAIVANFKRTLIVTAHSSGISIFVLSAFVLLRIVIVMTK